MINESAKQEYRLNVLYACDENYAPFAGVSLTSLFRNNPDIDGITAYLVLDHVSDKNQALYRQLADQYHREVVLIDAEEVIAKIKALKIPLYRGSYTTNFRLFFTEFIRPDVERLLYLDCDTLILGSLKPLLTLDMQGKAAAMALDSQTGYYKGLLYFRPEEPYYNAGITLLNVPNWEKLRCTARMLTHIQTVRAQYCNPDQDLLNIVLKGQILVLPAKFNLQVTHRAYSPEVYFKAYPSSGYYTAAELAQAAREPVILHSYRFLGQFPWHTNNLHPDTEVFDAYLKESLWHTYQKKPAHLTIMFKMEHFMYHLLPHRAFLQLFSWLQIRTLRIQNAKLDHPAVPGAAGDKTED